MPAQTRRMTAAELRAAKDAVEGGIEDTLSEQIKPATKRAAARKAPARKAAPRPAPEPEVIVIDEEGYDATSDAPAVIDDTHPAWDGPTFELHGEEWEAEVPTKEGLMAFALATGKFIDPMMQANFMGLFCREHLSPWSLSRLFERLLDRSDEAFDQDAVGEILKAIAELADA